ncbi:MAG: MraY family glycosyltransferase [Candidatus Gracilibacteria bacterium]
MAFTFLPLIALAAGLTMWVLTWGVFSLFRRFGIVDKPHLYPHEQGRAPIPYPGGIVLMLNMFLWSPWIFSAVAEADIKKSMYVVIAGVFTSLLMAWDDQRRTLSPLLRLGFQVGLGAFFGLTAIKIGYISNIFGGIISLDQFQLLQWNILGKTIYLIPLIITIGWYVLVMNAINWSDNGRAMTSSVGLVTLIVLGLLSVKLYLTDTSFAARNNSVFVFSFLTILIPTIFVFWRYDTRRACIVGDAGTMFLGYIIATLAIVSGGKIATASIVLGIYFIDAFYVILGRIRAGKNPMKGDLTHLHHRMTLRGVEDRSQRYLVMALSFFFGLGAIFLDTWGKIILFGIICTVVVYISQIAGLIEGVVKKNK